MKGRRDSLRKQKGRGYDEIRLKELERLNKKAPLITYNINVTITINNTEVVPKFEVYNPNKLKGRKGK